MVTRPEDIPADVWDEFRAILSNDFIAPIPGANAAERAELLARVCRHALAYGQSRADEATERAARVADAEAERSSTILRADAAVVIATAIRSQK